ncbi:MAG: ROK family transcriptional regulator, partial [Nonomuraea sp.]|nr:ROK family transcriptional regulator [Nonomuraea sp.]
MKTATPAMARAINDRLALDLLLERGPLTAPQLRELTGLSRPTVSDLIERLRAGGLIEVTGESGEDRRGPNARLYGIVTERAYVAGVDIRHTALYVRVADIAGQVVGEVTVAIPAGWTSKAVATRIKRGPLHAPEERSPSPEGRALSELIAGAVAAAAAGHALDTVVVGAPGLVDPATGDLLGYNDVPGWYPGLLQDVRQALGVPVVLENNVNLAAIAERRTGAAAGRDDFVLI